MYAQHADDPGQSTTGARARDLLEAELADSSSAVDPGLLVLVEQDPSGSRTEIVYAATPEFQAAVPEDTLQRFLVDSVDPVLDAGDLNAATIVAVARPLRRRAADPPEAQAEQVIHDTAGLLDAGTIRSVTLVADHIADLTAAGSSCTHSTPMIRGRRPRGSEPGTSSKRSWHAIRVGSNRA